MTMSKITFFLILISGLFLFSTCDIVEAPYIETPNGNDTSQFVKKVLVEDYTGHNCPNCPAAAVTAAQLKNIYGDQLVVMAVHAGFFADPVVGNPLLSDDFRTDAGNAWNEFFHFQAYPNGMVDRVPESPGVYPIPYAKWGAAVGAEFEKNAEAKITVHNDFSTSTRQLTTNVFTEFITAQADPYNLIVCVTQDSIIGGQKNSTTIIEDYVFMDMLRGSLNGNWGENVTDDQPIEIGISYQKTYSKVFPPEWIAKNCHVVAFVYNTQTKSIVQVEEKNVVE